ncbi:hypothetical protein LXL04_011358 [Taraxacum kok-saghyz]
MVFSFRLSSLSPPRSRYTLPLSQISSQPLNCTNNDSQNLLPLALLFTSSVIDSTITTSPTGAHVPSPSGSFGFDNKCTLSCSRSRCKKMCLKLCGICCGKWKIFGFDPSCADYLKVLIESLFSNTACLLTKIQDFTLRPNIADDCFLLTSRCIRYCLYLLLPSLVFSSLVECSMTGITVQHRLLFLVINVPKDSFNSGTNTGIKLLTTVEDLSPRKIPRISENQFNVQQLSEDPE